MFVLDFFKTRADKPLLEDPAAIKRLYDRKRREVFFMLVFGYSFYYVCRLALSFAKKPMIESGVVDANILGQIGFAFYITYALGKFTNGFLADRANIGRFVSTGLLVSALILIAFGSVSSGLLFVLLWGISGYFQAMGSAPCGVSISQWFSNRERGTRYSIWSLAHSAGEGISMVVTAVVIAYFGWRWGFWGVGMVSVVVALAMYRFLADRPQTYGLPAIADYKNDHPSEPETETQSVGRAQLGVLRNPYVWILGLSSACMYVARYGINSWGPMYLQEAKDYTLISAGLVFGWAKTMETIGAVSSGFVSDYLFNSRRNVVTLAYSLLFIGGLIMLCASPSTRLADLPREHKALLEQGQVNDAVRGVFNKANIPLPARCLIEEFDKEVKEADAAGPAMRIWMMRDARRYLFWTGYCVEEMPDALKVTAKYHIGHLVGIALFCFGLGGLLVFLGGLIAIDITTKEARGAALGIVGMFSYLGAAIQERVSGLLIQAGKVTSDTGAVTHDYTYAVYFWVGAAVLCAVLACTLWNVKAKD